MFKILFRALLATVRRVLPWRVIAIVLVPVIVVGCATRSNLEPFPPLATDKPPGASPQALRAARGLGRGINFGNMLDAPSEGDWGLAVSPEFIDVAVAAGFTSVRLPVRWSNHAQALRPFTLDEVFTQRVDNVVNALLAKGLYVVLNVHHDRLLDGDPLDVGDAAQEPGLVDERFLTLWQQVASRFFAKNDHLLFELYNEPHGRLDAERWNDLQARALGVVRQYNPKRVVLVSPVNWSNAKSLEALRLPNDPHLIATIHHYEPFKFTHQGAFWITPELPTGVTCCNDAQRLEVTAPLDVAKAWSDQNRYPVFLGEFGSFKAADLDSRTTFTRTVRQQAEARGLSWAYWELAAQFGVYDPVAKAFRPALLRALMGSDTAPN